MRDRFIWRLHIIMVRHRITARLITITVRRSILALGFIPTGIGTKSPGVGAQGSGLNRRGPVVVSRRRFLSSSFNPVGSLPSNCRNDRYRFILGPLLAKLTLWFRRGLAAFITVRLACTPR